MKKARSVTEHTYKAFIEDQETLLHERCDKAISKCAPADFENGSVVEVSLYLNEIPANQRRGHDRERFEQKVIDNVKTYLEETGSWSVDINTGGSRSNPIHRFIIAYPVKM